MWWRAIATNEELVIRRARPLDAAALARVQVDSWRETYRGIVAQTYLDAMTYTQYERQWRRTLGTRGWAFLAVFQGQIVGLASAGPARHPKGFAGELYVLYLLRRFHGRGIGRALFDSVHLELARRGVGDMLVRVLADNPNRSFYERLGGEVVGEASCVVGGVTLRQVAYGWRD